MHLRWTAREVELGRTFFVGSLGGVDMRLEVYDGGGFCPSHGVWRVAGKLWGLLQAGSA
jgi:hypothetical protein